jgi:hypothetical protein
MRCEGRARGGLVAILVAAMTGAGCGGGRGDVPIPVDARLEAKLANVGEIYRLYSVLNKRPPRSLDDLSGPQYGNMPNYEAIQGGEVVVLWGSTLPDTVEEPGHSRSDKVLAYLKTVPQDGGPVLMLDRTVRRMTPEEFRASTKGN